MFTLVVPYYNLKLENVKPHQLLHADSLLSTPAACARGSALRLHCSPAESERRDKGKSHTLMRHHQPQATAGPRASPPRHQELHQPCPLRCCCCCGCACKPNLSPTWLPRTLHTHRTALHAAHYSTQQCSTLPYSTVQRSTLLYSTVQCSTLLYAAVHCISQHCKPARRTASCKSHLSPPTPLPPPPPPAPPAPSRPPPPTPPLPPTLLPPPCHCLPSLRLPDLWFYPRLQQAGQWTLPAGAAAITAAAASRHCHRCSRRLHTPTTRHAGSHNTPLHSLPRHALLNPSRLEVKSASRTAPCAGGRPASLSPKSRGPPWLPATLHCTPLAAPQPSWPQPLPCSPRGGPSTPPAPARTCPARCTGAPLALTIRAASSALST